MGLKRGLRERRGLFCCVLFCILGMSVQGGSQDFAQECNKDNFLLFIGDPVRTSQLIKETRKGCDLSEVELLGKDLSGYDFRRANFSGAKLNGSSLEWGDFTGANFRGANLTGVQFNQSDLTQAMFHGATLKGAEFKYASFRETDLEGVDLSGLDWSGLNLRGLKLKGALLKGTDLTDAYLEGTDLSGADLSGAKLVRSGIVRSNLSGANLREVNLTGAVIILSNLSNADFSLSRLDEAYIFQSNFWESVTSERIRSRRGLEVVEEGGLREELSQSQLRIQALEEELRELREGGGPPTREAEERSGTLVASWPEGGRSSFEPVVFVSISAGSFLMGSPGSEANRDSNEGPQHRVTLTRSFEIQRTEVTQWHWFSQMGENPSRFDESSHCPGEHVTLQGTALCPNHPVEVVSWSKVQIFLTRLNAEFGRREGYEYRLPTEAEWEYAARAGTQTAYSFGNRNNARELGKYGWFIGNSGGQTRAVASLLPNPWGLYDVHGNVWEWVQDLCCRTYTSSPVTDPYPWGLYDVWEWVQDLCCRTYTSSPVTDPLHASGRRLLRVLRGGAWSNSARYLRSAFRGGNSPRSRNTNFGFRLVRVKN